MNKGRLQSLIDSGFDVSRAYRLEAVLSNDESGLPRTKQDQDFVNQCHKDLLSKIKG
jgi:hypothetical protein